MRGILLRRLTVALGVALLVGWRAAATVRWCAAAEDPQWTVDFRFAPTNWQTAICLPDDAEKTLVAKSGDLLYDFQKGKAKASPFQIRLKAELSEPSQWVRQELVSPRVPIVRTVKRCGQVEIVETALAQTPPGEGPSTTPRRDLLLVRIINRGDKPAEVTPWLRVDGQAPMKVEPSGLSAQLSPKRKLVSPERFEALPIAAAHSLLLQWVPTTLAPGQERAWGVVITSDPADLPQGVTLAEMLSWLVQAERWWQQAPLPYGHLEVPDAGLQSLLDSSVRNIYQAREIKDGLPAFQVGPTVYRGLWVVDGSFLLEAVTYLNRAEEARAGIRYLMSFQRPDGSFMLINGHWKETGIVLWALSRHARLTGDRTWLNQQWPKVEKAFAYIQQMRRTAASDENAPNARLVPTGFSDGGLGGPALEYTNVYWNLVGVKAAVDAAVWLGKKEQARAWQAEYDDFLATFRKAAHRDSLTDAQGNRYVPIAMKPVGDVLPQRAQWAFLHAVFPGRLFPADDPLVRGNMAMLRATEQEGMVFGTGWIADGIWNYFASFYGHAWLWLGDGGRAGQSLYAFANHASPLLCWREEQMPQGKGDRVVGDMPHNWASAELIRLVRHMLVLERGEELHLLEGLPAVWLRPGAVTKVRDVLTQFGPISLELKVSADGTTAQLHVDVPRRDPPSRAVVHLGSWAAEGPRLLDLAKKDTIEVSIPLRGGAIAK